MLSCTYLPSGITFHIGRTGVNPNKTHISMPTPYTCAFFLWVLKENVDTCRTELSGRRLEGNACHECECECECELPLRQWERLREPGILKPAGHSLNHRKSWKPAPQTTILSENILREIDLYKSTTWMFQVICDLWSFIYIPGILISNFWYFDASDFAACNWTVIMLLLGEGVS